MIGRILQTCGYCGASCIHKLHVRGWAGVHTEIGFLFVCGGVSTVFDPLDLLPLEEWDASVWSTFFLLWFLFCCLCCCCYQQLRGGEAIVSPSWWTLLKGHPSTSLLVTDHHQLRGASPRLELEFCLRLCSAWCWEWLIFSTLTSSSS